MKIYFLSLVAFGFYTLVCGQVLAQAADDHIYSEDHTGEDHRGTNKNSGEGQKDHDVANHDVADHDVADHDGEDSYSPYAHEIELYNRSQRSKSNIRGTYKNSGVGQKNHNDEDSYCLYSHECIKITFS